MSYNMIRRLALFAALLAWCSPAAAQSFTGWPLAGAHAKQPCSVCHKNNVFKGTPRDCYSCHRTDFNTATTPVNHIASNFPTTCDSCHRFSDPTWMAATFSHTTFPLVGVHATTACTTCHNPPYAPSANNTTAVPTTCYGCHVRDFTGAATPVSHTGFPTTCDSCHKNTDATWSQKSSFVHNAYFALAGAHITAPCAQCHTNNNYISVPKAPCSGCHQKDYNTATTPVNHITSNFPTTCDSCHKFSDVSWMGSTFSHTTFPLVGVHATTACTTCHNPPYAPSANNTTAVPTTCYGCHVRDFTGAATPVSHTGFPTTCDSCHKNTDATWSQKSSFVHNTYFALAGAHVTAPCAQCHTSNNYISVPKAPCSACHQKDYNTATTPVNHVTSNFPTTCDSCHKYSDATWSLATFSHTTFPLVGVHATTACTVCHNPPYAPSANNTTAVPTTCYGCHVRDFTGATTPVSHTGFPTTCDSCHKNTDATWAQKGSFVHNAYWALAGAHVTAPCAQCHANNNYISVPKSPCSACHQKDYNAAKTPVDHIASGFPTTCDSCHKFTDPTWMGATFSHTTFPLVGVHKTTACATCHNPPYAPSANNTTAVPTTCYGCHVRDFTAATTPVSHTGFPTTCDSCHRNTDATWAQKGSFVHNTYFALAGAHVTAPCAQCHTNNNYISVPKTPCSACHQKDYNTATTPVNHITSNFPNTCDSCHKFTDATWSLATFSHTTFPLVGLHATTPCATCHNPPYAPSANNYTAVPTTCYGCHVRDFNAAKTPVSHTGFPTTCDSCHKNTDATWSQKGSFVHTAYFALAGAHVTAPCAQCHTNNNYISVPKSPCSACHQADYLNAKTPIDHIASSFPNTCDSCHKFADATWMQGTFNHTAFPITSGRHNVPCAQCHMTPNVFTVFTCTVCHTQSKMASEHNGRNGYVWTSVACYSCHPNGRS